MAFGTGSSWGPAAANSVRRGAGLTPLSGLSGGSTTSYTDGGGGGYSSGPTSSPFDQYVAQNPQYLAYGNQLNRIASQIPFQGSYYDTRQQGLNQDYANSLASIGLQGRGLGVDRGAIARDQAYYDAMKAMAGKERANQGDINNNQLATQGREINSAATAAGNWFAPGRNDKIADAYKGWGTTNTGLDISYQRDLLGLDRQKAEAGDRAKKLDLAAEQLGLDKTKLKTNLEQGLAALGYDRFTNMNSLLDALDSTDANRRMLAQQIITEAVSSGVDFTSGAYGDRYSTYNPYQNHRASGTYNADRRGR